MSGHNPMRRSMARVEFLACMESVESMLRQGFSKQLIYERLMQDGRVSMAYVTFAKLIAKAAKNDLPLPTLSPPTPIPPVAVKPAITPKTISAPAAPKKLIRPEDVDRTSLF